MQLFYTSPWVPAEWIKAHGLEPRSIWLDEELGAKPGPLCAGACAFAQWTAQLTETREAAFVFTTHCDQLRRTFDMVASSARAPLFLFNLPTTWQGQIAQRLFAAELQRLERFLMALDGRAPSEAGLREIMKDYDAARARLRAAQDCDARIYAERVARFHDTGTIQLPAKEVAAPSRAGIPLALLGGPLPQSQWAVFDSVARAGGRIVLNATEAGERTLLPPLVDNIPNPFNALVQLYTAGCVDVFQRPNTRLYAWLKERLLARKVRGIILWAYVNCDLWRAEAASLREAFGMPVLLLDADEAQSAPMRNITRIEAFLELLA